MMAEDLGIDPERVCLEWVSGAEGPKFAKTVTDFTETIKALGPNTFKMDTTPEEVAACR